MISIATVSGPEYHVCYAFAIDGYDSVDLVNDINPRGAPQYTLLARCRAAEGQTSTPESWTFFGHFLYIGIDQSTGFFYAGILLSVGCSSLYQPCEKSLLCRNYSSSYIKKLKFEKNGHCNVRIPVVQTRSVEEYSSIFSEFLNSLVSRHFNPNI